MIGDKRPVASIEAALESLLNRLPEGAEDPYPSGLLARQLGIEPRTLQQLVGELIDRGYLVGSTCGTKAGYFLITSEDELEQGTRHIVARARSSFRRVSKLRRAAAERFGQHVERLFDVDQLEEAKT